MISDKNRVFDGWISLEGGVDGGRAADMLEPNQVAGAINMSFRGGTVSTRPGFRKLEEEFPAIWVESLQRATPDRQHWCYNAPFKSELLDRIRGEYAGMDEVFIEPNDPPPGYFVQPEFVGQNSEYVYKHGKFQCAHAYSPHYGEDCIMAMIGGRLFKIIPKVNTSKVTEIIIDDDPRKLRNMERFPMAYMCQADKWLIVQDGISAPIIYDGSKARRSKTSGLPEEVEIPVGTITAYGMGRIVTIVNDRDVAFGDLQGSHDLPDPSDSLILFTERNFLTEGFDAAIPFQQGVVTGMMFIPQLDSSTGNGQLMVFAERGATSFFLSLDRELWKTSTFQVLSLLTTGMRGHRSISVVNEDLWFRSDDGMRSYRQARSEPSGWAHIPLSTNVRQYLENDSEFLLKYCSAMYFDNRILVTTSPMWFNGRPIHWGMVVVDFDIISAFGGTATQPQASKPAWEGEWISPNFLPSQIFTGTFNGMTRAFVFGLDNAGQNSLFELSSDDKDDYNGTKIGWEFDTRSFDFNKLDPQNSTVFTENELYDADIWLKEVIE
jgi:hypothetical protein